MEKEKVKAFFIDPLPLVKSDRDLDAVRAKLPGLDDYYIASGCIAERRIIFEKLWESYEPYADDDFLHQHRLSFHQRSWEMYLGYLFLNRGFNLLKASSNRPDLCLMNLGSRLWIEAIAPTHGVGPNKVPEIRYRVVQNVPFDEIVLRVSAGLKEKFLKQKKYLNEGVVSKNEPYIIAVNRGFYSIGDPYEMPLVMQCLFGVGHLTISLRPGSSRKKVYFGRRTSLSKTVGDPVPMTFFENPAHSSVSAVIYSARNVLSAASDGFAKPSDFGKDCIVIHNPLANNPISLDLLSFLVQYHVNKDGHLVKV